MKTLSTLLFMFSIFILGSCSVFKMSSSDFIPPQAWKSGITYPVMTSGLKPGEITDLLYLGPVSNISLIGNGNAFVTMLNWIV